MNKVSPRRTKLEKLRLRDFKRVLNCSITTANDFISFGYNVKKIRIVRRRNVFIEILELNDNNKLIFFLRLPHVARIRCRTAACQPHRSAAEPQPVNRTGPLRTAPLRTATVRQPQQTAPTANFPRFAAVRSLPTSRSD